MVEVGEVEGEREVGDVGVRLRGGAQRVVVRGLRYCRFDRQI